MLNGLHARPLAFCFAALTSYRLHSTRELCKWNMLPYHSKQLLMVFSNRCDMLDCLKRKLQNCACAGLQYTLKHESEELSLRTSSGSMPESATNCRARQSVQMSICTRCAWLSCELIQAGTTVGHKHIRWLAKLDSTFSSRQAHFNRQ